MWWPVSSTGTTLDGCDKAAHCCWPVFHTWVKRAVSAAFRPPKLRDVAVMTVSGTAPSEVIADTSANAAGPSNCSGLPEGSDMAVQVSTNPRAASVPSSGTAQIAGFQLLGLVSMRTTPLTSPGYNDANVTASAPPKEWPTTRYGPSSLIVVSSECRSCD